MWALRRASYHLKNRGFSIRTSGASCTKSEAACCYLDEKASNGDSAIGISDEFMSLKRFYSTSHGSPNFSTGWLNFSSQADTRSSDQEEDDLEDGFSELGNPASADVVQGSNVDEEIKDELIFDPQLSDDGDGVKDPQNELEFPESEAGINAKRSPGATASSAIFKAIMAAPRFSFQTALHKWQNENELTRSEISLAMLNLRKRRMYWRALLFSEWLESTKRLEFVERDYASRLDLIAKVRGLQKAENYIEKIPESFRGEKVYRTLLANCVATANVKKAEEVFDKMKDLGFPITLFTCNQLLLLYKRLDKKKIVDVLLLMKEENLKPTHYTYSVLIDAKGQSNDITGMDQIVEAMKEEGIEPSLHAQSLLVKHYISAGLVEKAEAVLKEIEGGSDIKDNRGACRTLLTLFAALGKANDVGRIWKVCETSPKFDECMAAIEAWGTLNKVEEAELVFDRMLKTWKKTSSRHYSAILKVYANNKMLAKGKDLMKRMADNGARIGPLTWDALVKLYLGSGDVEKANLVLQKATQQNQMRPLCTSYMAIMEQYAKRGDVHNTEKMLLRMKEAGYMARPRQFQTLMEAYINAKAPAYGMSERMKADNVFPNKVVQEQMAQVDAFRKTAAPNLLD